MELTFLIFLGNQNLSRILKNHKPQSLSFRDVDGIPIGTTN